ncbi:tetracycline transporter [Aspergillus venezuelensis]
MAVPADQRNKTLRVLMTSLLLDLISFTFILPLFPSLLTFYRNSDPSPTSTLNRIFDYLHAYKNAFAKPIDSSYDIVLLGGALGSLFSLLQAIAAPFIGRLSDKYGRRTALLASMAGNTLSVALWVAATDFRTFLASRVVGGLSEGNIQLAHAIATDISDPSQRGSYMALVGACFSIAFTFGPALGAYLSTITSVAANPFATAAGVSLALILLETIYIYARLPETHPRLTGVGAQSGSGSEASKGAGIDAKGEKKFNGTLKPQGRGYTNNPTILNILHFAFLLPFSGMEFSLPFLTATFYTNTTASPAALNGRLLSTMGLIASLLQGSIVRRLNPLTTVRIGVVSATISFFLLSRVTSLVGLYTAASFLAVTSATVVTGLNSLGSLEAREEERGVVLGRLRSWGQVGRAAGPVLFCSLFWWVGREVAYLTGSVVMLCVCIGVFGGLKRPVVAKPEGKKA